MMDKKFLNLAIWDSRGTGNTKNVDFSVFRAKNVFFHFNLTVFCQDRRLRNFWAIAPLE